MNTVPEKPFVPIKVVSNKNLPLKSPVATYALLYVLFSKVYELPSWADMVAGAILAIWMIVQISIIAKQVPIDIFKE